MAIVTFEADQVPHLADILMGCAYADDVLDGREVETVESLMSSWIKDAGGLPDSIRNRIAAFDPDAFDLQRSARALGDLTLQQRRAVFEALAQLEEADEEIDLREDEYLRRVAEALGSTPDELSDLTVDVEVVINPSRPVPPPAPSAR